MSVRTRSTVLTLTLTLALLAAGAAPALGAPGGKGGGSKTCKRDCTTTTPTADTTAPVVAISSPGAGATVTGAVSVVGTSSDAGGAAAVAVQVDGGAWQPVNGTTSWSWTWSTTSADNGTRTLTARATDAAGNISTTSRSVTVSNTTPDTSPPTVSFSTPGSGTTVTGTTTVSGSAGDDRGIAQVEVRVDGGGWSPAVGTTAWTWAWSTTTVPDGSHTLTVRATDAAGNSTSASRSYDVRNSSTTEPTDAPDTQGSWTSPEGVRISVNSAGPWTIRRIYTMLRENASAPGDFARIGPTLSVNVQDTSPSAVGTTVSTSGGVTSFRAQMTLKGVSSTFSSQPDSQLAHEYGHVWSLYHLHMSRGGDWSTYLGTRWSSPDGTRLADDGRLDSTYSWSRAEILADDYRLLFGSPTAVSQRDAHMNWEIPDPRTQTGLREFLLRSWAT